MSAQFELDNNLEKFNAPSVNDFFLIKPISRGAFGWEHFYYNFFRKVYLGAKYNDPHKMFAIKIVSKREIKRKNLIEKGIIFDGILYCSNMWA